jgi:hypothetical protein
MRLLTLLLSRAVLHLCSSRHKIRSHIDAINYIPVAIYLQLLQDFTFLEGFRFRRLSRGVILCSAGGSPARRAGTMPARQPAGRRRYIAASQLQLIARQVLSVGIDKGRLRLCLFRGAALGTVAPDFQPGDDNVEAAIPLNLPLQTIKEIAFEFRNLAASQTSHVDVVPLRPTLVEVLLTLHVHEIEFVNQSVPLQKSQSAIDSDPVNLRIDPSRSSQQLTGVKVLLGSFHHTQNGPALARHAQPARHKFGLQTSRDLSFWKGHGGVLVATRWQL